MKILKHMVFMGLCAALFFQPVSVFAQKNMVEQTRDVGSFSAVSVGYGIDAEIEVGSQEKVVVMAKENAIDDIRTKVEGNTLIISRAKNWRMFNDDASVLLTVVTLNTINASGGSDVSGSDIIKSDNLTLTASGGSDLELEIEAEMVQLNISGGSDRQLSGQAGKLEIVASGGSDLDAEDLSVKSCMATLSGASDAHLHVTDEIQVVASGASDIVYTGTPRILSQQTSGSSSIRQKN